MIALLAGIAIVMLIVSEIAGIAPTRHSRRYVTPWLGALALVLLLFAVVWFVQIQGLLTLAP